MAYIGAEPVPGQNREIDDISSGFNGSATAFTLQVSSTNVSPESANNILVNLGGVMQNPGTDYTIAASTITFTTAPASGLSFWALILGAGINTATVADQTIGTSKVLDNAITADKLAHTSVTAGSYTTADITVDAQGRITAAASGSISGAEIANNAVTTAKIADSTGSSDGVTTAKLATDAVTAAKLASNSVVSDSIVDGSIVNADVNASAAIDGSKISPDFGSQNIATGGDVTITSATPTLKLMDSSANPDYSVSNNNGVYRIRDLTNLTNPFLISTTEISLDRDLSIPDTIVHTSDTNTKIRFPAADTVTVETGGSERARVDSQGRFLIGTTSYKSNLNASADSSGQISQFVHAGDNINGCLSVFAYSGSTSPTTRGAKLQLHRARSSDGSTNTILSNGDLIGSLEFKGNDGANFTAAARIDVMVDGGTGTDDMPGRMQFFTSADGSGSPTERMRITSAGCVNIGSTTNDNETDFLNILQPQASNHHSVHLTGHTSSSFSGSDVLKCVLHGFYRQSYGQNGFLFKNADDQSNNRGVRVHKYQNSAGTTVGSIFFNSSSTDFNTSSDYRLKENEVLISDGIARIKQLKPYKFNFKQVPSETVDGFFAHEVAEVVPHAVGGDKDEMEPNDWYKEGDTIPSGKAVGDVKGYSSTEMVIQQLDYSKLVPLLTAALQEAIAKIETLETKVAALEAA